MSKYCLKKASHRQSCKKRYRIEKKVREHSRKLKKSTKKNNRRRPTEKTITVPSKCPFKDEILAEAEQRRSDLKEQKLAVKKKPSAVVRAIKPLALSRAPSMKSLPITTTLTSPSKGGDLFKQCMVTAADFQSSTTTSSSSSQKSKPVKAYAGEVRKTIDAADVVIEVLDARDPLGSRSRNIEQMVLGSGKRLVLLLNKIDLVPKENVTAWLAYLKKELPCIAFKASTQEQSQKLGRHHSSSLSNSDVSSKCVGAALLMKLLGNYCRNKDIKTAIRVGIVGFPNVGKSSVINSLKRKKICLSGAVPGLTRRMQEIELDKHVRLIDSPGVVLASRDDQQKFDPVELALKNALRVETMDDPISPVLAILRRCSVDVLMVHYNIPCFENCYQFLGLVARKLGRLRKGGLLDFTAAAKHVLHEWNNGKLRYYTQPPVEVEGSITAEEDRVASTELLSAFSKEFDLDGLEGDLQALIEDEMPESGNGGEVMLAETLYDPNKPITLDDGDGEEGEEMDIDALTSHNQAVVVTGKAATKKKESAGQKDDSATKMPTSFEIDGSVQLNTVIRNAVKKRKKQQKKIALRTDKLADSLMGNSLGGNDREDYDFSIMQE